MTDQHPLTPREQEVIQTMIEGETYTTAGRRLGISPRTVRFHLDHARAKMGAKTVHQLVAKVVEQRAVLQTQEAAR